MADSKIVMFPDHEGGNNAALWATLANNRNNDSLAAMMGSNGGMNGMWNNPIWAIVFLAALRNGGIFGNNGNGGAQDIEIQGQLSAIREQLSTDHNSTLLMDSIKGVNGAVRDLATSINCDFNAVNTAIQAVQQAICNVGSKSDMNAMQTINAINSGNSNIANQLAQCCCTIREAVTTQGFENLIATLNQTNTLQNSITQQGYQNQLSILGQTNTLNNAINSIATGQERGFSSVAYETQRQTCDIENAIKDSTSKILEGQRAAEMRELQNKVDALRELNSQKDVVINNGQLTAVFSQMIGQATAPIAAAVNNLQQDVNGIKCKLPETVTLPFNCATAIPTSALYNGFGLFGGLTNFGNNSLWG